MRQASVYEPRFVDMCRKYAASTGFWNQEPEKEKPDYDKILAKGIDAFDVKMYFWYAAGGSEKKIIQKMIF